MLGFYNYTVILTYISLCSAVTGIFTAMAGTGHPFIATTCLMVSGLCDAFDGMVARHKTDRTKAEKNFGIQIDSLVDLVAFGVLPCAIGYSCYIRYYINNEKNIILSDNISFLKPLSSAKLEIYFIVFCLYVLAAVIRLAYFNVMEEERQSKTNEKRKEYTGLPVTSASLIFPIVIIIQYIVGDTIDISPFYVAVVAITAFLFVSKLKIKKPGVKGVMIMVAAGVLLYAVMIILYTNYAH